jgi:hypothetical protein
VLPQTPDSEKSDYVKNLADLGKAYHHWSETGEIPASLTPGHKKRLAKIDRAELWPEDGRHEVAYAYDVLTRQFKELGRGRDAYAGSGVAELPDWTVTGTVDYEGPAWVDDLKTGKYGADWVQLDFGAAAIGTTQGAGEVTQTTTLIPMSPQSAEPARELQTQSPEAREEFLADLETLYGRVLVARGQLKRGSLRVFPEQKRCQYCPARAACPNPAELPERAW